MKRKLTLTTIIMSNYSRDMWGNTHIIDRDDIIDLTSLKNIQDIIERLENKSDYDKIIDNSYYYNENTMYKLPSLDKHITLLKTLLTNTKDNRVQVYDILKTLYTDEYIKGTRFINLYYNIYFRPQDLNYISNKMSDGNIQCACDIKYINQDEIMYIITRTYLEEK